MKNSFHRLSSANKCVDHPLKYPFLSHVYISRHLITEKITRAMVTC